MQNTRLRGLNEKIVTLFNPLPERTESGAIPSKRAFAIEAGLTIREASSLPIFRMLWNHGGGLEREVVCIDPGAVLQLRQSEADDFLREFRELGAVALDDPNHEAHKLERSIEGVDRALEFWAERGQLRIIDFQMRNSYSDQQMANAKRSLWDYYANQKLFEFLERYRASLQAKLDALSSGREKRKEKASAAA